MRGVRDIESGPIFYFTRFCVLFILIDFKNNLGFVVQFLQILFFSMVI